MHIYLDIDKSLLGREKLRKEGDRPTWIGITGTESRVATSQGLTKLRRSSLLRVFKTSSTSNFV